MPKESSWAYHHKQQPHFRLLRWNLFYKIEAAKKALKQTEYKSEFSWPKDRVLTKTIIG